MQRTRSPLFLMCMVLVLCAGIASAGCGSTVAEDALVPYEGGSRNDTFSGDQTPGDASDLETSDALDDSSETPDGTEDTIQDTDLCDPNALDEPDPEFIDLNCDGIDGDEESAVFAAPHGFDENPGTSSRPLRSVQKAVEVATLEGKDVYLQEGFYEGPLRMIEGVNVYGGFGPGWVREERFASVITGVFDEEKLALYNAIPTVVVENINTPTSLVRVEIEGISANSPGSSVIGVYIRDSSTFTLRHNFIITDDGAPGDIGSFGQVGLTGDSGNAGNAGCDGEGFACIGSCSRPGGGAAGDNGSLCGGKPGGAGGRPGNPDSSNAQSGDPSPDGASGGAAGPDFTAGGFGSLGAEGSHGVDGGGGDGLGVIMDDIWRGSEGASGEPGSGGTGGGGGGGGGGGNGVILGTGADACYSWGGTGGGGGAGGCGGTPGTGGGAGGGAFGVFVINSTPEIYNNKIQVGAGGPGGLGGPGSPGGLGGDGGDGGAGDDDSGFGGDGGAGGRGGSGGAGGGGGGGVSFGIYAYPDVLDHLQDNSITSNLGGSGGLSSGGENGEDGASGEVFPAP